MARKAQEAEEAARRVLEAAEAARRAQEEAKRQKDAEEATRRVKEAEEATKLSEEKTKKELQLQLHNQTQVEMDKKNDGSNLVTNSQKKESQQFEAGPQCEADPQHSQDVHTHNRLLVVLEKHNVDIQAVPEANIALPEETCQNTISFKPAVAGPALPKTNVSAEECLKIPQTGSPTTNTTHPEPGRSRAPPMGKLPTSRSQEKRELRRQRGLEHSQRESVRAAAACKDETCTKHNDYTFINQKSGKPKKETDDEGKVKKEPPNCPIRPSTLALEVLVSKEPSKHTPGIKDMPSRGKLNTQPEITLKEPGHHETRMLKYGLFLKGTLQPKVFKMCVVE